jgi:hypothetical protein
VAEEGEYDMAQGNTHPKNSTTIQKKIQRIGVKLESELSVEISAERGERDGERVFFGSSIYF